jgi:EAL domain-containing protein (putative c-di-GMP-specific phosphodiesterase class I)
MASRQFNCEEYRIGGSAPRLRVLIAGHDTLACEALAKLVVSEGSLELVGAVRDADEAVHLAHVERPDVALVDAGMPAGGGPMAVRGIRDRSPHTRVVALSSDGERGSVLEMLQAGIDTYLDKGGRGEEILHAIHHVGRGQNRFVPDLIREMTMRLADQDRGAERDRRRIERVQLLVRGEHLGAVFQPIVDLRDGRIIAAEALARISMKPTRSPAWWIGEAWAVGLGAELELAALRTALAHLEQLPREVLLTVNVSPRAFVSPKLIETMGGVPPGRVVVEVTEDAPVQDYDVFEDGMRQLRARGVRLAIDDAGAGFSSLGGILRLAPEFIKLDISLIRTIASNEAGRATASALIRFASDIGAEIIAEGIESQTQLQALRGLGVVYGQGFYLARPAPLPLGEAVHPPRAAGAATSPKRRGSGGAGAEAREDPAVAADRANLADAISSLRRTAAADPFSRAGNLQARIRALKAADHAVGQELVKVGAGRHTIRYLGRPPWPDTLLRLADELEAIATISDSSEVARALRVFDLRLHWSIPSSVRKLETVLGPAIP